jgi:hypothetical protein
LAFLISCLVWRSCPNDKQDSISDSLTPAILIARNIDRSDDYQQYLYKNNTYMAAQVTSPILFQVLPLPGNCFYTDSL